MTALAANAPSDWPKIDDTPGPPSIVTTYFR